MSGELTSLRSPPPPFPTSGTPAWRLFRKFSVPALSTAIKDGFMRPCRSLHVLLALAIAVPAALPAQTLTFAAPVRISSNNQSGYTVQFLYLYGNFNGNGNTDIIDAVRGLNNNNVFEFLAGDGTGNFTDLGPVNLTTANAPSATFAADVNGDGKDDIITLESACVGNTCANPGSFNVLLSQGNGQFTPGFTASLPAGYLDLEGVVGDFNNDGKPDVAVLANTEGTESSGGQAAQLLIFLNNGNGGFTQTVYHLAPSDFTDFLPTNLVTGDFEGNGNQDLAFAFNSTGGESSDSPEIWTFAGNGKGGFGPAVASYAFDSGILNLALYAADLNGDGRTDLVTQLLAKQGDGNTRVPSLLARESGTFYWSSAVYLAHKPFTSYPVIALSDLNGDGKPDLIFLNGPVTPGGSKTAQAGVYLGLGNGAFKTPHIPLTVNASDFAQFIAAVPLKTGALPSLIVTYQLDYLELFVNTTKK